MEIEQNILKFRIDLLKKMPFYGDILTHLQFEERKDIGTAATDGFKVMYNPVFLTKMRDSEGIGAVNYVLMHEVFHILLQHPLRGRERNRDIWNIAADLVVNHILSNQLTSQMKAAGIPFVQPKDGLFSNLWANDTVEFLYEYHLRLNQDYKSDKKKDKKNKIRLFDKKSKRTAVYEKKKWAGHADINEIIAPGDLFVPSKKTRGTEKNDGAFHSDPDAFVRDLIKNAANKSVGTGGFTIPSELAEMYSLAKDSKKLDWKKLLRNHLNEAVSDETSYSTPERKYLHMDLIVPGHSLGEQLDEVWAFVDSSGSVSKKEMEEFLTQLYRIVKEFQCTLHLCYWDTTVNDVYRNIRREKDVLKSISHHSGGTDINCVYRWIREKRVKPGVMVILTDGYFGTLTNENRRYLKRENTVIVLSTKTPPNPEQLKKMGTPAFL